MPYPSLEGGQEMSFLVLERMTRTAAGLGHPDTHPFHMPLKQADGGGTCMLVPKQTPWQAKAVQSDTQASSLCIFTHATRLTGCTSPLHLAVHPSRLPTNSLEG